jgi:uncharacterized protein
VRAVFDTNIFVSALALPGTRAELAIRRVVEGADVLLLSRPIVEELMRVLAVKFRQDPEQLARTAVFLWDLAEIVHPRRRLHVLKDDADNRILECAVSGNADVIVTGDRAMLALGSHGDVRVITLREYLADRN